MKYLQNTQGLFTYFYYTFFSGSGLTIHKSADINTLVASNQAEATLNLKNYQPDCRTLSLDLLKCALGSPICVRKKKILYTHKMSYNKHKVVVGKQWGKTEILGSNGLIPIIIITTFIMHLSYK